MNNIKTEQLNDFHFQVLSPSERGESKTFNWLVVFSSKDNQTKSIEITPLFIKFKIIRIKQANNIDNIRQEIVEYIKKRFININFTDILNEEIIKI